MGALNKSVKVSICIPTYNHVDLVKRALGSVLSQTFLDYEVIITDDSDHDAVKAFVLATNDARVHYVKNPMQLGSPANWNAAVSLAQGEYIKILHHDDWFPNSNCLQKFVDLLDKNPKCILGFSSTQACRSESAVDYLASPTREQLDSLEKHPVALFFANFIGAPSTTILRRDWFVSFDSTLKWLVDIDFYISVLSVNSVGPRFAYSEESLICVTFDGSHQITNDCSGNKDVEVFEYVYLYNKIRLNGLVGYSWKFFSFFTKLFGRYRLVSVQELSLIMRNSELPIFIRMALIASFVEMVCRELRMKVKSFYLKVKG